jgi:hypothetical protein
MSMPTFDRPALKVLRKTLLSDEQFLELSNFFIEKMKEEELTKSSTEQFNLFFGQALGALATENVREVAERSKSPIEKMFLNLFILGAIKSRHLISVHTTFKDSIAEVTQFRRDLACFRELEAWFAEKKPCRTLDEFLDGELARGKMPEDERGYLHCLMFKYHYLPLADSFHMTIQPRFPTIKIDGKSMRPDIYFWIPARPDVNIIVECDGYQSHFSKDRFTHDRQRDRKLKSLGYEVLRFSGQEIHRDPVAASAELQDYLVDVSESVNGEVAADRASR